jgi:hypothetical protein
MAENWRIFNVFSPSFQGPGSLSSPLRIIFGGFPPYFKVFPPSQLHVQVMLINLYRGVGFGVFLAYFYELHKAILGPCFGHDQVWSELQAFFPEIRGPFSHIYQQ